MISKTSPGNAYLHETETFSEFIYFLFLYCYNNYEKKGEMAPLSTLILLEDIYNESTKKL